MAVYFISDLHLKAERPDLIRALLHFLKHTAKDASALYLLGDIFEAWIGDDAPAPEFSDVFNALQALHKRGCNVYFQHGNRDFLVGETFAKQIGATLLDESVVVQLPIGPALLLHGDQLCTDDVDYQAFRSMVRNPDWQNAFLAKPLNERIAIAKQLRDASKARAKEKSDEIMDVNADAVRHAFNMANISLMIHGHTHRPDVHEYTLESGLAFRVVLGDWDQSLWYLRVDEEGLVLVDEPIEPAA